jgi:hypothetical protein
MSILGLLCILNENFYFQILYQVKLCYTSLVYKSDLYHPSSFERDNFHENLIFSIRKHVFQRIQKRISY